MDQECPNDLIIFLSQFRLKQKDSFMTTWSLFGIFVF